MKRVILSLVAVVAAVSMAAQGPRQDQEAGKVRPKSNHTVSTTLGAGLEYGFEWAFAGHATVVGRIGYLSKDFTLRSALDNFQWVSTMVPGVTIEPRYYFLMNWLASRGENPWGNAGAFFGVPATATLRKDAKGLGEAAVSPVLGFRGVFGRYGFHEFTAGADLLCYPAFKVTPHVGYRIGIMF